MRAVFNLSLKARTFHVSKPNLPRTGAKGCTAFNDHGTTISKLLADNVGRVDVEAIVAHSTPNAVDFDLHAPGVWAGSGNETNIVACKDRG